MSDIAATWGIPADLMSLVNVGFFEILSENPDDRAIRFSIPSMRERGNDGNTLAYSLKWCRIQLQTERGYRVHFELVIRHEEADYDYVEMLETTEALIAWLSEATQSVRRNKVNTPLPTPEKVADVFCTILNEWLPADAIAEVNRRNGLPEYRGCCASHDFCDPNQAMIDAMWSFGVPFSTENQIFNLIYDAWSLSRQRAFAPGHPVQSTQ